MVASSIPCQVKLDVKLPTASYPLSAVLYKPSPTHSVLRRTIYDICRAGKFFTEI